MFFVNQTYLYRCIIFKTAFCKTRIAIYAFRFNLQGITYFIKCRSVKVEQLDIKVFKINYIWRAKDCVRFVEFYALLCVCWPKLNFFILTLVSFIFILCFIYNIDFYLTHCILKSNRILMTLAGYQFCIYFPIDTFYTLWKPDP